MSGGSYTLALSSPPCAANDWALAVAAVPSIDQHFFVLETFQAGVAVAGPASFSGVATFSQSPVFSAGISVPSEIDLGVLSVSGLTTLSGGLTFSGAVSMPASTFTGPITATSSTFSGQVSASGGLTVVGACTLPATTLSGALIGTSATFSGVLSCASEVDAGIASFGGLLSANAGLMVAGSIVLPQSQVVLTPAAVVAVNLASFSCNFFTLAMTSSVTGFTFANMLVNANFAIYLTVGSSSKTMNKALSSGGITCYNNLSGNTSMAANSLWYIRGVVVSATVVYLEFLNMT